MKALALFSVLWLAAAAAIAGQGPSPPRVTPPEAIRAEAAGDWEQALEIYRDLLAAQPAQPELWLRVADVEAALGHAEAAAAALEQAALLTPEDAALQLELAQAHSVAGRPQQALAAADRAFRLEPENLEFLRARAQLATWAVRYDLARDSYERILRIRDDDRSAVLGLARVEAWSGELDEAVAHYRTYTERYPEDAASRLEHARAEAWRGNYPVALSLLEGYRESLGETEAYQEDKARFLLGAGWPNAALEILSPRLESEPDSFDLNADYTLALAASGRPRQALESLENLALMAADNPRLEEVHRVVATPMRAAVVPMVDHYRDSDGVERAQLGFDGGLSLSPRTRLSAGIYSAETRADAGSGLEPLSGRTRLDYSGVWAGLSRRIGHRVLLQGRVGESEVEGGDDLLTYRLGASFELSDAFDLHLGRRRSFYSVSPRALDLGIANTSNQLRMIWRPDLRYHLEASAVYDSISDGNDRWELVLAPRRTFLRREHFNLDLGLRAWWFGFDRDLSNGYYDPGSYRSYSVTGFGYWKINDANGVSLVLTVGGFEDDTMDDFELGGSANVELTFGIDRDWMLKVRAGGTENSRVQSGAFNAWGGGIFLTRRLAGPGGNLRESYRPEERTAEKIASDHAEPDYAAHFRRSHAPATRSSSIGGRPAGQPPEEVLAATPPQGARAPESEATAPPAAVTGQDPVTQAASPDLQPAAEDRRGERVAAAGAKAGGAFEAPSPAAGQRIFELQLALFHYESNARRWIDDLVERGYRPYLVEVTSSKGETRYTVRIGPYRSMDEAQEHAARIRQADELATVIRYRSKPGSVG